MRRCGTVDFLYDLAARVARDGAVIGSSQGDRAHPALVEIALAQVADCLERRCPRSV